jgi:hypothetical protein
MAVTVNALFKKSAPAPAKTVKKTVRDVDCFFLLFYESKFLFIHSPALASSIFFLQTGPGEEGGPGEEANSGEESTGDGQEDGQEGRSGQDDGENRGLVQVVR